MKTRNARAFWTGDLLNGYGIMQLNSIDFEANFSFASRFEDTGGTNPEELIAAAHAGCFSMSPGEMLSEKGFQVKNISTTAHVTLSKGQNGFYISKIELLTDARIPGIDKENLRKIAEDAKKNCPVSKALSNVDIELEIELAN
jgi:lipoyl-dependent peroxiredoxin